MFIGKGEENTKFEILNTKQIINAKFQIIKLNADSRTLKAKTPEYK